MPVRMSRREFLKLGAGAGVAVGASALPLAAMSRAFAFSQSPTNIRKFVTNLPGLGPSGANQIGQYIPMPIKRQLKFAGQTADMYNIAVSKFKEQMHPDLPGPTHFFGYHELTQFRPDLQGDNIGGQKYLGGVIVANRDKPVILTVTNLLPKKHILPIDDTIMAAPGGVMVGDLPYNRVATHLHGGFSPWFSDGTAMQWFSPTGQHGPSFMNIPGLPSIPGTGNYYWSNQQSSRMMWYHDHADGITRTNAYAGIATAYVLVDNFEIDLVNQGLLPDLVGIPLVIQDKGFVPTNIATQDPTWQTSKWGGPGSLWYPHEYEANFTGLPYPNSTPNPKGRVDWGPTLQPPDAPSTGTDPLPAVSIVPEAFFDTILINGGVYPVANVPAKRVRFRMLNAAQARFFHLNLYPENPGIPGEALVGTPGPTIYQVGTEGGLLPAVAVHDNTTPIPLDPADPSGNTAMPGGPFNMLVAPAERTDFIIDFNGVPTGSTFILYNDSPSPFPGGDSRNDYFTGQADQTAIGGAPTTAAGFGPNTRTVMKFVVTASAGDILATPAWLTQLNSKLKTNFLTGNQPGLLYNNGDPSVAGALPYAGVVNRRLTLNEDFDMKGRLIQTLGTFTQNGVNNQGLPTWGRAYFDPTTETVAAGAVEVWQIFNQTMDVHPIHLHLVNAQIIQRQPYAGMPGVENVDWSFTGPPTPPDANERGWKETVRMNPGEAITIIAKFDLPTLPTAAMRNAVSPRTGGKEYMWHCHILEHEEHDMMRPIVVT